MNDINNEIGFLNENVSSMIELIAELRKIELVTKQEVGALKTENENLIKKVRFLEEKNKMVDVASTIDPESRDEMKLRIRELVREIDGCIAMIKN